MVLDRFRRLLGFSGGSASEAPAEPAPADGGASDELYRQGIAALAAGCNADAERLLEDFLAAHPEHADAYYRLGLAQDALGRRQDAMDSFAMALHYEPRHAAALRHLGVATYRQGDPQRALELIGQALELAPGMAAAHNDYGFLLFTEFERPADAAEHFRRALALDPALRDAHCNLGMCLRDEGRVREAIAEYDLVLAAAPDDTETRFNRAVARLSLGDYAGGWPDYELRKQASPHFVRREFPFPEWDGTDPARHSILVHGEQGLGDEIMFASCLPDLIAAARHCVVECSPRLESLFRRSFPAATVVGADPGGRSWQREGVPPVDCYVAIGSLPRYFRSSLADFPAHSGYLRPDPRRVEHWRSRLAELGSGLKVGLSWRGGTKYTRRLPRSLPLEALLPLMRVSGKQFVSLQYGEVADEVEGLRREHGLSLPHWQEAIDDYDETAALVTALDLVVSVCTAVVHLSGAVGRQVWILTPYAAEWRYLQSGAQMPWYPAARLFRQAEPGAWGPVLTDVAAAFGAL